MSLDSSSSTVSDVPYAHGHRRFIFFWRFWSQKLASYMLSVHFGKRRRIFVEFLTCSFNSVSLHSLSLRFSACAALIWVIAHSQVDLPTLLNHSFQIRWTLDYVLDT